MTILIFAVLMYCATILTSINYKLAGIKEHSHDILTCILYIIKGDKKNE